jgi:hypothetical protein
MMSSSRSAQVSGGAFDQNRVAAVVADAVEALRQDMPQEAADKFWHLERHGGVAASAAGRASIR